jgi:predicted permease
LNIALSTPGIVAAALSRDVPLRVLTARTVLLAGAAESEPGEGMLTLTGLVSQGYFATMEIPLLRGRDFSAHDGETAPRAAIVNQAAAERFWPGGDAIGRRLQFFGDPVPANVIGVVRNANYRSVGEPAQPFIYLSLGQYYSPIAAVYVRSFGDPEAAVAHLRKALQPLDRNLLLEAESFERALREALWAPRLSAGLLAVFGALAVVLAVVGVYGVLSYSVNLRLREIGVRMALGASPREVQVMVLRQGFRLIAWGVLAGLAVSLAGLRWIAQLLYAGGPGDFAAFLMAPAILTRAGMLACWLPARRATRVHPAAALRDE